MNTRLRSSHEAIRLQQAVNTHPDGVATVRRSWEFRCGHFNRRCSYNLSQKSLFAQTRCLRLYQVLEIRSYYSALIFAAALTLNHNPLFEIGSNLVRWRTITRSY